MRRKRIRGSERRGKGGKRDEKEEGEEDKEEREEEGLRVRTLSNMC